MKSSQKLKGEQGEREREKGSRKRRGKQLLIDGSVPETLWCKINRKSQQTPQRPNLLLSIQ